MAKQTVSAQHINKVERLQHQLALLAVTTMV
jgi:hypothetical protein